MSAEPEPHLLIAAEQLEGIGIQPETLAAIQAEVAINPDLQWALLEMLRQTSVLSTRAEEVRPCGCTSEAAFAECCYEGFTLGEPVTEIWFVSRRYPYRAAS